jgi:branched-chain amino acid transport system substrate-binding protein
LRKDLEPSASELTTQFLNPESSGGQETAKEVRRKRIIGGNSFLKIYQERREGMKNCRFITIMGFIVLGLLFSPGLSPAAEDVKIGVILPLTGPTAQYGMAGKTGVDFATEEINAEGGIKSLGGAKIKVVFGDSQGKPDVATTVTEQLIHKDNVAIITGTQQSGSTLPTTAVAERYKVPYLVLTAVNVDICNRGFKYTFRSKQNANRDAGLMVEGSYAIGEKAGVRPKNFAVVYENSEWGQGNAKLLKQFLGEKGGKIVFEESYVASASDLTPLVLKIKAAKPDVLLLTSYVSDAILLSKTIQKQKLQLMASVNGGGGQSDPTYLPAAGNAADYEFSLAEFDVGLLRSKKWVTPINAAFKAKYGVDFMMASGEGYSNMWLIKDVLERAASIDREKIREAFVKTNYTSGKALIMPYRKIVFNEKGENPYADETFLQASKGKYYIVYPFEIADPDYKAVWPRPGWK